MMLSAAGAWARTRTRETEPDDNRHSWYNGLGLRPADPRAQTLIELGLGASEAYMATYGTYTSKWTLLTLDKNDRYTLALR